ncbi:MAG TPA: YHS domain-containing (seleno)protein [Candidatus Polarisedimenticolia bacterium]|nr:YHS domain-containing (seleno)protein [Candidatus Polarisedimenticolia bacterium]
MRSTARSIAVLLLLSSSALAADLVNVSGASKVAIDGFDPVAFFTDSKPVNGSPTITATHQGAVYFFATEEHRRLFEENPARYKPQYGGFCAYGVGHGALAPVDINTWQVRNGKLYLNFSPDVLKLFNAEFDANVAKAEKNWPGLVSKKGE